MPLPERDGAPAPPVPPVPDALRVYVPDAAAALLVALCRLGIPHVVREHEAARHARHLASIWEVALDAAARATLFQADDHVVLVVVPADRKVSAPVLREALGASFLRVLRGDRGVGRLGWVGLPGAPGPLPALPAAFAAACLVDEVVLASPRLIISLEPTRSLALPPDDYVRVAHATLGRFVGATRLLPEGGMVDDPPLRAGARL